MCVLPSPVDLPPVITINTYGRPRPIDDGGQPRECFSAIIFYPYPLSRRGECISPSEDYAFRTARISPVERVRSTCFFACPMFPTHTYPTPSGPRDILPPRLQRRMVPRPTSSFRSVSSSPTQTPQRNADRVLDLTSRKDLRRPNLREQTILARPRRRSHRARSRREHRLCRRQLWMSD